jgi:hypothetical protein
MWDGRETREKLLTTNSPDQNVAALQFDLRDQANAATRGHAQASRDLTDMERQQSVDCEMELTTAQAVDFQAGPLTIGGATCGARNLLVRSFVVGSNDLNVGTSTVPATVEPPDPGMTLFAAWAIGRVLRRRPRSRAVKRFSIQEAFDQRRERSQQDARVADIPRHMYDVPQRTQRGQSLHLRAAQHRHC